MHIQQKSFSNYARSEFGLLLTVIISYRFIPFHDEHLFFRSHSFWYQNRRVVRSTILWATWAFCDCLRFHRVELLLAEMWHYVVCTDPVKGSPYRRLPACVCAGWEELPPEVKGTGGVVANALSSSICLCRGLGCFCRRATKRFLAWVRQLRCDPSVASKFRINFAPLFYGGDIDQPRSEVTWAKV